MIDLEIRSNLANVTIMFDEMVGDSDKLIDDILRTSSNYQVRATKKRFPDQMGPDGEQWPPLSPLTIKRRKKGKRPGGGGTGNKRLLDSGALRTSIVPERTKQNEVKITTNKPYAVFQNYGVQMKITKKQAWWMVFNLYGYDPKKMSEIARHIGPSTAKGKRKSKQNGGTWRQAFGLWKALYGKMLIIPPAPFMGFSRENVEEIEKIAVRHVELFLMRRGRDPIGP